MYFSTSQRIHTRDCTSAAKFAFDVASAGADDVVVGVSVTASSVVTSVGVVSAAAATKAEKV